LIDAGKWILKQLGIGVDEEKNTVIDKVGNVAVDAATEAKRKAQFFEATGMSFDEAMAKGILTQSTKQ